MFVTMFYALLDPVTGKIAYVNAGHNPPLLCRADKDELETLTRTGMALGVVEDSPFEVRTLRMNPGDFVLLYTDGVTAATDAHERSFGMDRLRTVVLENRRATVPGIVSALEQSIQDFVGPMAQFDDVAIVVVKCLK